ncbi:MAG: calcium-binding protein [Paracoccaceae bacterium]
MHIVYNGTPPEGAEWNIASDADFWAWIPAGFIFPVTRSFVMNVIDEGEGWLTTGNRATGVIVELRGEGLDVGTLAGTVTGLSFGGPSGAPALIIAAVSWPLADLVSALTLWIERGLRTEFDALLNAGPLDFGAEALAVPPGAGVVADFGFLQAAAEIVGSAGADALTGGAGDDAIVGGAGADGIAGGAGDDSLTGGADADMLGGGGGNDTLLGGAGADSLEGGAGDDLIRGGGGRDSLFGDEGHDRMNGGAGGDFLYGGDGNDTMIGGAGNDSLSSGGGDNTLRGGDGDDYLYSAGSDLMIGGTGRDTLHGTSGNETMLGAGGFDELAGLGGDDLMTGGAQADLFVFIEDDGNDTITDFEATNDFERIDLSRVNAITGLADLELGSATSGAATQVGADVVIDTGGGNSITLLNVALSDLDASDFVF